MCGIAGIYIVENRYCKETGQDIKKMTSSLTHRGPDDCGYYIDDKIALGHRRLKIIDLETGRQPMFNEDKSISLVFNGEIYNYRDLRRELQGKDHRFSTNSDTETVIHAYEEWGEECLKKLRGMFAFCIWDSRKETIFLARDRLGIKPLFYSQYNGKFVFASEIKSIISDIHFKKQIDKEALASYFMFSYIPAPLTIYKNIKKLLPGYSLILKKGNVVLKQYWDLFFEPDRKKKEEDFIHEYMELLEESVKMRLMSDVPLGAFLSGGIDSSVVVALMSNKNNIPANTFTIGFGGDTGGFDDERKYARLVARRYNTNHREHEVLPDVEGVIEKIVNSFDEPFADDATIPSYFVCKMARENVTVALSGLGGDEAFCGYERYLGFHISHIYNKIPGIIREKIIRVLIEKLPENSSGGNRVNHLKRFVRSSSLSNAQRYLGFTSKLNRLYKDSFFSDNNDYENALDSSHNRFLRYFESPNAEDPLDKVFYCDIKTYLPEDILACTDRLSMHHSLEVRVPFLDHKLLEFSATIPSELKLKWFQKKYLLKKGVSHLLPKSVVRHKKQGFVGPMTKWLQTDLKKMTLERLSDRNLERHGIFNRTTVSNILNDHYNGRETNDTLIWSLLMFQTWFDAYMN
ncbi:asparagine synthase [Candidatus Scalindua japonica]|uniref:asparagine synthase (glutamine-hydrolyzing) n=1 Tax=Candidatus Scalindua japonica TaxID=1284222 RepID=A0A286U4A0_9BACT|nr:asparagine synthase (glutamine-hydrolyzing) [Candidatus Scalindua japonica]GAX62953.1 asparagine synthase [Candidatus Scalindua japonica]